LSNKEKITKNLKESLDSKQFGDLMMGSCSELFFGNKNSLTEIDKEELT